MDLQYNNKAIKLILELRRRLPTDLRDSLRLTDPNLTDQLVTITNCYPDPLVRSLVRRFISLNESPSVSRTPMPPRKDSAGAHTSRPSSLRPGASGLDSCRLVH